MDTTTLIRALDRQKFALFGTLGSLEEALNHAYEVLGDSHKHDIHDAIDVYHNTLINELQKLIEKEAKNEQLSHVH